MKILIVTQWYPPEPMKIYGELANTLHDLGNEVTVLTGLPNWPSGVLFPGYKPKLWQEEQMNGIRVIRVWLYPDHSRSAIKRTLNLVSFCFSSMLLSPFLCSRPDIIYLVTPPITAGVAVMLLSKIWRVPYVLEIQDMWPESLRATGLVSNPMALRLVSAAARILYRHSSGIRVISNGFRKNLLGKGVPGSKVHVISNWVDTECYRPVSAETGSESETIFAGKFTVMYAGTIGLAQGLEVVLDAALLLRDDPGIQLVLVGDGLELDGLRARAAREQIANVKFLGRLPGERMPGLFACADVLLVHLRPDPLFSLTIPHKIFAYLATGKPVLAAMDGDPAAVIENAKAGLTCSPGDAAAMAEAVKRFFGMSAEERATMGCNGRRAACESFGKEQLVGQINKLLARVLGLDEPFPYPNERLSNPQTVLMHPGSAAPREETANSLDSAIHM
jgi:glycosyltransferase involved in cell wall biosynthesis